MWHRIGSRVNRWMHSGVSLDFKSIDGCFHDDSESQWNAARVSQPIVPYSFCDCVYGWMDLLRMIDANRMVVLARVVSTKWGSPFTTIPVRIASVSKSLKERFGIMTRSLERLDF